MILYKDSIKTAFVDGDTASLSIAHGSFVCAITRDNTMKYKEASKHRRRIYILSLFLIIGLTSCVSPKTKELINSGAHYKPLNLLPMYGAEYYPQIQKTKKQKESDQKFIESIIRSEGSREIGARRFSMAGWMKMSSGDAKTAMMRFNQAWLLDPDYYQPYWGFGVLMLGEGKPEKALVYFEDAMSRIDKSMTDETKEKPPFYVDVARANAWQASKLKKTDAEKSRALYETADKLIDDALRIAPDYGDAYRWGGIIAYDQANYERTWRMVKKSRETGAYEFDEKFIAKLSRAMPEPK